ncbi:hypothetical protein [Desertivirga xinjiangensis]|uniref:hypothetical protein n=1 Tax=Desertivirga xinjiangensis TaxID=539206 RepID=UPI00210CF3C9|nr:hypothetical protein [Pedobacter xinjiangensis]
MILEIVDFSDLPTGSQADWVQAGSSILAAVGLVITLLLQWKTSRDQTEMLKLEREKDRRSIMPVFKIFDQSSQVEHHCERYTLEVILDNADANNLKFKRHQGTNTIFFPQSAMVFLKGDKSQFDFNFKIENGVYQSKELLGYLFFCDMDGNQYQQVLNFSLGNVYLSFPSLVK